MNHQKSSLVASLMEFGREAYKKGLIWGNSGNISCRLDDDKFLISGSSENLEKVCERDFVVVNLEDDYWEGEAKPSIEVKMHKEIYKAIEDVCSVFHSQPFFTTLISCTNLEVDNRLFPESMAYIGNIGRIPYHHPGSDKLAKAVSEKVKECDALILGNHGAICIGESLEDVLLKTETLEFLCRIIAFAKVGGIELNYLSQTMRNEFLMHLKDIK